MLKSKLFYAMAVSYIAALAVFFQQLYPSVSVTAVGTVLALLGLVLAAASYLAVKKLGLIKEKP